MIGKKFLFLLLLHLIEVEGKRDLRPSSSRKSVKFSDNLVHAKEQDSSDFNFGESSKRKRGGPPSSHKKSFKPAAIQAPKLKSALKSTKRDEIIFASKTGGNQQYKTVNSGAYDLSSQSQSKAFYNDPSSIGQLENTNIFAESDDGPILPQNPYRNVGPTPEFLSAVGPERFWLPPNAPITQEIPGPFLPYNQGIPGQIPFDSNIPVPDAYLPQVTGVVGPRDVPVLNDPITAAELARRTGPATIPGFEPEFQRPRLFPPLNPVTPIPGGNIIDPLSPQVNNVQGPFFPGNPRSDGAFLITNEVPPPQLVARDLEDGAYIVERVIDPIVFFDPVQGQTVVFDPLRNFTRLYNPETDPELPSEEVANAEGSNLPETANAQGRINGGGFLKSTGNGGPPTQPAFWILKKLDDDAEADVSLKTLEKSGGGNGKQNGNGKGSRVIFQSSTPGNTQPVALKSISMKKKPIIKVSHYKAPKQQPATQDQSDHFRIQLADSNPNEAKRKVSKTTEKDDGKDGNKKVQVTLVYSPIVDIDLGKRYEGFKANRNNKNSASTFTPFTLTNTVFVLIIAATFLI